MSSKYFAEAMDVANAITESDLRAETLGWIVDQQISADQVGWALDTATAIANPATQRKKLSKIVYAQLEKGDRSAAIVTAGRFTEAQDRAQALATIAGAYIETGEKGEARRLLDEAVEAAKLAGTAFVWGETLGLIGAAQVEAGDLAGTLETAKVALKPKEQVIAYAKIAAALAQAEKATAAAAE